jgi:drug/metabolite transporter (DMT)-like permease
MKSITTIPFIDLPVPASLRSSAETRVELWGVLAAVASSGLGGASIAVTRFVIGATDPLMLGAFRFGIGFVLLLPIACWGAATWPPRQDWLYVGLLGLLFFGLFPILFNASLLFTTAARAALALSTLPLLTMAAGALLGIERLTTRKSPGVVIATAGVALALVTGLAYAPAGAWRGDLLMVGAALCMALYNVWSRPFIARSGPIPFTAFGMGVGGSALIVIAIANDGLTDVARFGASQWSAVAFLGLFGSALTFYLWAFALARTTPTRVAISVTVNPIMASIVGALLLSEPLLWNVIAGLGAVVVGIWIATTGARRPE